MSSVTQIHWLSHHVECPVRRMMIVSIMVGTCVVLLCQVAAVWENVLEAILNPTEPQKVSALSPGVREQLFSGPQWGVFTVLFTLLSQKMTQDYVLSVRTGTSYG